MATVLCVVLLAATLVPLASANPATAPIQILSPWGVINPPDNVALANRPVSLDGANIGMIYFDRLGAPQFVTAIKNAFGTSATFEDTILDQIRVTSQDAAWYNAKAADYDAVIIAMADTTNIAYWATVYAREFEMRGVPTVVLTTSNFLPVLQASAGAHGITEIRSVVIPNGLYHRAFNSMAAQSVVIMNTYFATVVDRLTAPLTAAEKAPAPIAAPNQEATYTIPALNSYERQLQHFHKLSETIGFGDGMPLTLPTREAVNNMLAGTTRAGNEILGTLRMRYGIVTVEKIAINAVMAGALPSSFPVILAAMEAIVDGMEDDSLFHYAWTSGDDYTLMLLLSGPIARELDFVQDRGFLQNGRDVQMTIGRAVRLSFQNIAHNTRGDMNTGRSGPIWDIQGLIMTENVSEFPGNINPDYDISWDEHHVTMGFDKEDSVVMVAAIGRWTEMQDTVQGWIVNQMGHYLLMPGHYMLRDARINSWATLPYTNLTHSALPPRTSTVAGASTLQSSRDAIFLTYNPDNIDMLLGKPEVANGTSRMEADFGRPIRGSAQLTGPATQAAATNTQIRYGNVLSPGSSTAATQEDLRNWFANNGVSGTQATGAGAAGGLTFANVARPASGAALANFVPFAAHKNVVQPLIAGQYPSYLRSFQSKGLGMDAMRSQLITGATMTVAGDTAGVPSAPGNLRALPQNGGILLSWDAPARIGTLVRYEASKDGGATWVSAGLSRSYFFPGASNDQNTFVVRAVNDVNTAAVYIWEADDDLILSDRGSGRGAQAFVKSDAEFLQERMASILKSGFTTAQLTLSANNKATLTLVLDGREIVLATNVNNRNVSGRVVLPDGSGTLVFDIAGNGSNVKTFRII